MPTINPPQSRVSMTESQSLLAPRKRAGFFVQIPYRRRPFESKASAAETDTSSTINSDASVDDHPNSHSVNGYQTRRKPGAAIEASSSLIDPQSIASNLSSSRASTESASVERALLGGVSTQASESTTRESTPLGPIMKHCTPSLSRPNPTSNRMRNTSPSKRDTAFRECSKHWSDDRFVLIQAQDVRFRLQYDRLERLSGWFREELAKQKYNDKHGPEEVVYLDKTGVKANEFEKLLDALDSSFTYEETPPSFDDITSILRTATALRFDSQSAWAARRLHSLWSPRLADITPTPRPHAIEAIEIARHFGGIQGDLHTILKPAFYELLRSTPDIVAQH
ncbi:hypothetical protein C0991_009956, partial [Blastosporella zonata]